MIHIAGLLVAASATPNDGAINATRIPITNYELDQIPRWLTVPIVLVVHAPAGGDYNPQLFVVCKDPAGERRGTVRSAWEWPDVGKRPSKYRCFNLELSIAVESEGEYAIGVYTDAEATVELSTPIPLWITLAGARPAASNGGALNWPST